MLRKVKILGTLIGITFFVYSPSLVYASRRNNSVPSNAETINEVNAFNEEGRRNDARAVSLVIEIARSDVQRYLFYRNSRNSGNFVSLLNICNLILRDGITPRVGAVLQNLDSNDTRLLRQVAECQRGAIEHNQYGQVLRQHVDDAIEVYLVIEIARRDVQRYLSYRNSRNSGNFVSLLNICNLILRHGITPRVGAVLQNLDENDTQLLRQVDEYRRVAIEHNQYGQILRQRVAELQDMNGNIQN